MLDWIKQGLAKISPFPLRPEPSSSTIGKPKHVEHKRYRSYVTGCRSFEDFVAEVTSKLILRDEEGAPILDDSGKPKPNTVAQGDAFEVLSEALLNTHPLYRHLDVKPIPRSDDRGVDKTASREEDGLRTAIQDKFTSNPNYLHTWRGLATFYGKSAQMRRLFITAGAGMNKNALENFTGETENGDPEPPLHIISRAHLDTLTSDDWERMEAFLNSTPVKARQPFKMREHQVKAHDDVIAELESEERATFVMPPGTGKTLVSLRVAESIVDGRPHWIALALVPSLPLLDQQMRVFVNNTHWHIGSFRFMAIGSGKRATEFDEDSDEDEGFSMNPASMLAPPTTDKEDIVRFLKSANPMKLVFCTYQSSDVLKEAALESGIEFDITIFDEAHKCTKEDGRFAAAVREDFPSAKRLFMTATPRKVKPIEDDEDELEEVITMSDEARFGRICHKLTLNEALKIEPPIIVPFEIVICKIDSSKNGMDQERLERANVENAVKGRRALQGQWALKLLAIQRAMDDLGINKTISFHRYVDWAKDFASDVKGLPAAGFSGVTRSIDGETSTKDRQKAFREFEDADRALLSNCRCLGEGVDAPIVEMVAFIDAKKSPIDIVQAAGRAFRTSPGKKIAYIFLPLVVDEGQDETAIIATLKDEDFAHVGYVLAAMSDCDEDFQEYLNSIYYDQATEKDGQGYNPSKKRSKTGTGVRIHDSDTRETMAPSEMRDHLTTAVLKRIVPKFDGEFARFRAYKEEKGSGYVSKIDTKSAKEDVATGRFPREFFHWANNTRVSLAEIEEGATIPHKGLTQRRITLLNETGFITKSDSGDKRGGSTSKGPRPTFKDWESHMRQYHKENAGNKPPAYGVKVTIRGRESDLGSLVARQRNSLRRSDWGLKGTPPIREKWENLLRELGWLDDKSE